jgi:hypothetical protein
MEFMISNPARLALLITALFTLLANRGQATLVVVMRTDSAVFAGADSRLFERPTVSVCKIRQCGTAFVAFAGLVGGEVGCWQEGDLRNERIDVFSVVQEFCSVAPLGVRNIASKFGEMFRNRLQRHTERRRVFVGGIIKDTEDMEVDAVFFGIQDGAPLIIKTYFEVRDDGTVNPITETCPPDCEVGDSVTIGEKDAALNYIHAQNELAPSSDPVQTIRRMIAIEAEATHNVSVGGPIDILRVTSKGAEWIQRKPECQDIEAPLVLAATPTTVSARLPAEPQHNRSSDKSDPSRPMPVPFSDIERK